MSSFGVAGSKKVPVSDAAGSDFCGGARLKTEEAPHCCGTSVRAGPVSRVLSPGRTPGPCHLSRAAVSCRLEQPTPRHRASNPWLPVYTVLQPTGRTAGRHCCPRGGLLPRLFTLTRRSHQENPRFGRISGTFTDSCGRSFSVTLPQPHGCQVVSLRGALRCPDFPLPACGRQRQSGPAATKIRNKLVKPAGKGWKLQIPSKEGTWGRGGFACTALGCECGTCDLQDGMNAYRRVVKVFSLPTGTLCRAGSGTAGRTAPGTRPRRGGGRRRRNCHGRGSGPCPSCPRRRTAGGRWRSA